MLTACTVLMVVAPAGSITKDEKRKKERRELLKEREKRAGQTVKKVEKQRMS